MREEKGCENRIKVLIINYKHDRHQKMVDRDYYYYHCYYHLVLHDVQLSELDEILFTPLSPPIQVRH